MADVQTEHGFTAIAHELIEAVARAKFNGTQFRIILIIWRYTYGFKRTQHELAISFLAEATGIAVRQVERELAILIERNVVTVVSEASGKRSRILRFNKNYDEWKSVDPTKKTGQLELFRPDELVGSDPTKKTVRDASSTDELVGQENYSLNKTLKKGIYEEIVSYLNKKAGKKFSHKVKNTQELINGRLSEGRTLDDFKYVIDTKCSHWLEDNKMKSYLRPETLFRPKNFDNYLNQAPKENQLNDPSDFNQQAYDDALREWVMKGNDPADFKFDG